MQKFLLRIFLATYILAITAPFIFADSTMNLKMCSTKTEYAYKYKESEVTVTTTTGTGSKAVTTKEIDEDMKESMIKKWYEGDDATSEDTVEATEPATTTEPATGATTEPATTTATTPTTTTSATEGYNDRIGALFSNPTDEHATTDNCGMVANTSTGFLEQGDCTKEGKIITELAEFNAGETKLSGSEGAHNFVTTVYAGTCCLVGMLKTDNTLVCDDVRTIYTKTYKECSDVASDCQKRTWVIGDNGMSLLKLSVKYLYGWTAGIVGLIAVVTIIYNGVKISISGISGDVSASKDKILQAITAIVLLFLSGLILYTINPTFFG
ncbi:MAG: pilin [Candidatus Gracilibacteria bacterium]